MLKEFKVDFIQFYRLSPLIYFFCLPQAKAYLCPHLVFSQWKYMFLAFMSPHVHFSLLAYFSFFLAYFSFLLPCSVCLNALYDNFQNTSTCGNMNIKYPFGVRKRGCGLPIFQIDCKKNSSPVITIHGRNYTILKFLYHTSKFHIVRDQSCQFPDDPINTGPEYADTIFRITSEDNWTLNVFRCNTLLQHTLDDLGGGIRQCNATVYYSLSSPLGYLVPECPKQQVLVEVGEMEWVSNDTIRDESCRSCEANGGICDYNILYSTVSFVCYCKDGPRTNHFGHGMFYFNFLQYYLELLVYLTCYQFIL
jgi:hypothetical protein